MKEVLQRLSEHSLSVELTDAARKWLAREGFDPAFGARPLRRALQKHVESPLSVKLLQGDFAEGDTVIVDIAEDEHGVIFRRPDTGARVGLTQEVTA
jgi:ATP-dependent Clp protease ATP-binding subunit ClpC